MRLGEWYLEASLCTRRRGAQDPVHLRPAPQIREVAVDREPPPSLPPHTPHFPPFNVPPFLTFLPSCLTSLGGFAEPLNPSPSSPRDRQDLGRIMSTLFNGAASVSQVRRRRTADSDDVIGPRLTACVSCGVSFIAHVGLAGHKALAFRVACFCCFSRGAGNATPHSRASQGQDNSRRFLGDAPLCRVCLARCPLFRGHWRHRWEHRCV